MQLHHRLGGYLLTVVAITMIWAATRSRYLPFDTKVLALAVGASIILQAILGVITLVFGVPIWLGIAHQLVAALVLSLAVALAWRARRP